jgi:flagellar motor switch protein FliN
MAAMHESIAGFIGRVTTGLEELLRQADHESASVTWAPDPQGQPAADYLWWSCCAGHDPAGRIFAGASHETWEELGRIHEAANGTAPENDFAALIAPLRSATVEKFGTEVSSADAEPAEEPPGEWPSAEVTVHLEDGSFVFHLAMNPEMAVALGAPAEAPVAEWNGPSGPIDLLMHVELPVSVSLGRTTMRMKDLLSVTSGTIVELDQELDDEVEVRVNNCTIARGEVVSVDGHYGVRILEMVARPSSKNLARLKGIGTA